MSSNKFKHTKKINSTRPSPTVDREDLHNVEERPNPLTATVQRAKEDPSSLSPIEIERLQRTIGNANVLKLFWQKSSALKEHRKSAENSIQVQYPQTVKGLFRDKPSSNTSDVPRVIKTTKRANQPAIQRFADLVDDPYVPTNDHDHPALRPHGLANMGPYKFSPMAGTFVYDPPDLKVLGVAKFLSQLRKDMKGGVIGAEAVPAVGVGHKWLSPKTKKNITFHKNGLFPPAPGVRVAAATALYNTTKVGGAKYFHYPGKTLDALRAYKKGLEPRTFVSIFQEDAWGAALGSHTVKRHTLGGAEAPDEDAVAVRAAFGMLGGLVGGKVAGTYTPVASAWISIANADTDIIALNAELKKNWNAHRLTILTTGGLNLKLPRAGGNIVAYKTRNVGKWPALHKPQYLDPTAQGPQPLFYPDNRWDKWVRPGGIRGAIQWAGSFFSKNARFTDKEIKAWKNDPLTEDVSAKLNHVHIRIVASDNQAHGGWVINSAYPVT